MGAIPEDCPADYTAAEAWGLPLVVLGLAAILGRLLRRRWTLAPPLGAGLLLLLGAVLVPALIGAPERGKQKRSMADIRAVARAVEAIGEREHAFPVLHGVAELNRLYGLALPTEDAWHSPFDLRSGVDGYTIVSHGSCGELDPQPWPGGPTIEFDADIVLRNGAFVQWPEGQQR